MDPAELMTKARYEDDLEEPLAEAIIVAGAAGFKSGKAAGGSTPGFVVVSAKPLAEHMGRLREIAKGLNNGEDVPIQYVQANT